MYFKPRIFISSTMGDKIELREEIKKYFESAGAEVALYEKDLTPSVTVNTYREDILQTDFAIFIIDERYGNPTETGFSGTEEEFRILSNSKKPFHVYLKHIEKTEQAENFENLIKCQNVSYYYYNDENDLKYKLFSTCFTIAKDIIYANFEKQNVPQSKIVKMALEDDYSQAMIYCGIIERMKEITLQTSFKLTNSNLLITISDLISYKAVSSKRGMFIDKQIDALFLEVINTSNEIACRISTDSVPQLPYHAIPFFDNDSEINIAFNKWGNTYDNKWYIDKENDFWMKYQSFKQYVQQLKFESDLIK